MTFPSNLPNVQIIPAGLSFTAFDPQIVTNLIQKGLDAANLQDKRQVFDQAFEILVKEITQNPNSQEARVLLAVLLTTCASKVYYNQEIDNDPKKGFRKAATLSCISLHLQIPSIKDHLPISGRTIDELINTYDLQPESYAALSEILLNNIDQFVHDVDHWSSNDKKSLIDTLKWLSFSLQNMPETKDNYPLQKNWQKITIDVLSAPTVEKEFFAEYIDYLYNRGPFITELADKRSETPLSGRKLAEKKIASYQRIEQLLEKHYVTTDPIRLGRESQIANNSGLMLHNEDPNPNAEEIFPYFVSAVNKRTQAMKQCPIGSNARYDHAYLLNNALSGLVYYLVKKIQANPTASNEEIKQQLSEHKKTFENFLEELKSRNDQNTYIKCYTNAITTIDNILKVLNSQTK